MALFEPYQVYLKYNAVECHQIPGFRSMMVRYYVGFGDFILYGVILYGKCGGILCCMIGFGVI